MIDDYRDCPEISQISNFEHLPDLLEGIKEYGCILPAKNIQFPIIKHYLCAPSHKCNVLGTLFSVGVSGSGKSDIGKIANAIHGLSDSQGIVMATSTPTSIRNKINILKYGEHWQESLEAGESLNDLESNCILIWDDIKPSHLKNQFMLSLVKSSYNRKSATLEIAIAGEGKNQSFNAFSKKVTSSIHPAWQEPELIELKRRIFPIRHIPYSAMSEDDKAENLSPDSEKLILWDYVDFSEYRGFDSYWNNDRLDNFVKLSKDRKVRNVVRKANIDPKLIQLSYDLIITGMIIDDLSVGECCDIYENYWEYQRAELLNKKSSLEIFLRAFIANSEQEWNDSGLGSKYPHEIGSHELIKALQRAVINGEIIETRWRSQLSESMGILGYEQTNSSINSHICWKRSY